MFSKLLRIFGIYLKILLGFRTSKHTPVNFEGVETWPVKISCSGMGYINDNEFKDIILINQNQVFPNDNALSPNVHIELKKNYKTLRPKLKNDKSNKKFLKYSQLLKNFIELAKIPSSWRYAGLYYAGFSLKHSHYILPSWLWINGRIVHYLIDSDQPQKAIELADRLISFQLESGGWIVRYDYKNLNTSVCPVVAPNDSAYCSDHGLLTAYKLSGDRKYLSAAEKCAFWIMSECHINGFIMHGFNPIKKQWNRHSNIVDVGFTPGLFCSLYKITGKCEYLEFAKNFLIQFINIFYRGNGVFYTSTWNNRPVGKGIFARGMAWALEGMIPYYELTKDHLFGEIIDKTVSFFLMNQHRNGGWLYNLRSGPIGRFSGFDNKGIPVIASSLYRWKKSRPEKSNEIDESVRSSIKWCLKHIKHTEPGIGGIFSSNFEGGIVHSPNTEVAFVYSNCYLYDLLRIYEMDLNI